MRGKIGVIDIGTNSTRLLIARVPAAGPLEVLQTALTTTRLGENLAGGVLLEGAMERTVDCLVRYRETLAAAGVVPENVVVAATAAVREAANREMFLARVVAATGFKVRVLSGGEEAFYGFLGVVSGLQLDPASIVVVDVGGGSTEFVWWRAGQPVSHSLALGAVRMTEKNYTDDQITALITPVANEVPHTSHLVGVGGTVTSLAAMTLGLRVYDPERVHGFQLDLEQVEQILARLSAAGIEERRRMPGLQPERADIIPAGVRIVRLVMQVLGASQLVVSETDILHGLARQGRQDVERKNTGPCPI